MSSAEQTTSLTVGTFSPSVPLRVARRLGLLDARGLAVTEESVTSSPGQFRALLDGRVDAALTSPDNVLAYRFTAANPLGQTADVRIVSAVDRGLGLGLYARPGVEGAVVAGVDVPGSGFAFGLYALMEHLGLGGYRVEAMGSTPRRLRALLAGECGVTMLNAGNELIAEDRGMVRLAGLAEVCRPYLGTVLTVLGDRRQAAVRGLAAALRECTAHILDGRADELVLEEAGSALGLSGRLARRYLERLQDPVEGLVPGNTVDLDALRTVLELRVRHLPDEGLAGALDPARGLIDA
ncbi:ABC transporter substrate-binding protein [Nonomuraea typhae]|uniref:ABC transporter substrate-binding protein n=1 Tax=Nonomuraea typhae TaxID=2603600 RepID=A0ABW7Z330_9ACTN